MSTRVIKLRGSDDPEDQFVEVDLKVAQCSQLIKTMLEDLGDEDTDTDVIPITKVRGTALRKVITWAEYHKDDPTTPDEDDGRKGKEIGPWDVEFLDVDQETLFELILAANFLDIKGLLDVACKKVANMIKGKNPEEIRKMFGLKNDFNPPEEEQVSTETE